MVHFDVNRVWGKKKSQYKFYYLYGNIKNSIFLLKLNILWRIQADEDD